MAGLFELKQQRETALTKADSLLTAAEHAHRELTSQESAEVDMCMVAVKALTPQITAIEKQNTIRKYQDAGGRIMPGGPSAGGFMRQSKPTLSQDYFADFHGWLASGGQNVSAAMYEGGGGPSGGYVVPIVVDDQIVPLAVAETGVRKLASVIPTVADGKFPTKSAFGTAAAKAEGDGTGSNIFTGTQPTLGQFTLSAFMGGVAGDLSWELVQDVPAFQSFAVQDMLDAMTVYEEDLFINGTGTGQAQGLLGNVGAGTTQALSLDGILDLIGTLKALYHSGASFLMQRATSIAVRKLQVTANLFTPVWTRVGGQDYLHNYPVEYSQAMPANSSTNTPILFGDFKRGYLIGDRGGSGINVKILDQPKAKEGLLTLLAYRRMDGRVRRSEAIQGYTL